MHAVSSDRCLLIQQDRLMMTGRHLVRDVICKNCNSKLGWVYEYAIEESQRYKENKIILEEALIYEVKEYAEPAVEDEELFAIPRGAWFYLFPSVYFNAIIFNPNTMFDILLQTN